MGLFDRRRHWHVGKPTANIEKDSEDGVCRIASEEASFGHDPDPFPYGLKVIHAAEDAVVDIIFVHGLTGHRIETWTCRSKGKACFWPVDLLSKDFPRSRIATWGYDARVTNWRPFHTVGTSDVQQHAQMLCLDIVNMRERDNTQERPLLFLAHSLGGIVCKSALLYSAHADALETRRVKSITESTLGIMFFGTPHSGAPASQWATILLSAISNVKQLNLSIVEQLSKGNPTLFNLQDAFYELLNHRKELERPIKVACCFEEMPLPGIGEVVPYASAKMHGFPGICIPSDHRNMVKFPYREYVGYQRVLGSIEEWVNGLQSTPTQRTTDKQRSKPRELSHQTTGTRRRRVRGSEEDMELSPKVIIGSVTANGDKSIAVGQQYGGTFSFDMSN
ncbi:uncharacterized protein PV07_05704 [Cladophialophora immunda]|uniref:DUF676 domain-containing protein n=1 Tax=Cladophialophora immunda TaxID=569365 RepID=A0A0D2D2E6_9EURO|nr:uncharacterized protein PV07_05704 [Cladophialophora immunda]KIW29919.1 hypothetical protein PV07_05704 [Cladophialophora immunda]OQV00544.1 hypothetical protein CLAIMM_06024 [Cladophialophora immunda]